jgi:hypothetical protein
LALLFQFSGTSGTLSPGAKPQDTFERLPSNWIVDWRRLFDFKADAARGDLAPGAGTFNFAEKLNTLLTPLLGELPPGSFGGNAATARPEFNLALRNLLRGRMVSLASGQQMADFFAVQQLAAGDILATQGGADLSGLTAEEKAALVADTPLWFYVLREAEVQGKGERLGAVGSHIVAETFHRAIEASPHSILRDPTWRPTKGAGASFKMVHLLIHAFQNNVDLLNPLG